MLADSKQLLTRPQRVDQSKAWQVLYSAIANNNIKKILEFVEQFHLKTTEEQQLIFVSSEMQNAIALEAAIGVTEFLCKLMRAKKSDMQNFHHDQLQLPVVPLRSAIGRNDAKLVAELLDYGADIQHKDIDGATILHDAFINASIEIIEMLLAKAADLGILDTLINAPNYLQETPLHYAMAARDNIQLKSVIAKLLASNADYTVQTAIGDTPLHYAIRCSGSTEIADMLLAHAKDSNLLDSILEVPNNQLQKPLRYAISMRKENFVALLLKYDAQLTQQDANQNSALCYAVHAGRQETVQLLLNHANAKNQEIINISNDQQQTPLHYAIVKSNAKLVDLLLCCGAQLNKPDLEQNTPLHYAIFANNTTILKILLSQAVKLNMLDAIMNAQNCHKQTPLHLSVVLKKNNTLVELLSEAVVLKDSSTALSDTRSTFKHFNYIKRDSDFFTQEACPKYAKEMEKFGKLKL